MLIPDDVKLTIWIAVGAFVVLFLEQAKRIIIARVDVLIEHMQEQLTANQRRDIQRDEMQENIRRVVNGRGVHYELRELPQPNFDGTPPNIVENDRRKTPRDDENDVTAKKFMDRLEREQSSEVDTQHTTDN